MSALPCLTLMSSLKTIVLKYLLVCMFLVSSCCVHRDRRPDQTVSVVPSPRFVLFVSSSGYFVPVFCPSCPPFAALPSRGSREFTPPFAAQRSRRSREFTPPFADQPALRSQKMTPPSTANPSPPACLWLNARRPASDSMPAGSPLTHARWPPFAGKANPPLPEYHAAIRGRSRRRPWGKPTHRPRLPLVRGKGQPAVRSHSARRQLWFPPAHRPPPLSSQASRLWSRQPAVAVFDQTVTKVFLTLCRVCLAPEGSWYPWAAPWIFFGGGYKGPGCRGRAEGRGHGHHGPPALASWAPCSTLASVCLFRSGGPVLCMSLCRSWGVSRMPTPPPW